MPNKNKPHYLGHRQRLKKKLRENPEALADYEVLELLLGYALPRKDTKPLAKTLLAKFKNFKQLLFAKEKELENIEGVGPGISTFWLALREFLSRASVQEFQKTKQKITSPQDVYNLLAPKLIPLSKEEVWLVMLDNKHQLIKMSRLSQGTLDSSPIYVREILEQVLLNQAKAFILAHNHPSGEPTPSLADLEITRKIEEACKNLEVSFLDHLIIGKQGYQSLKEQGF